MHIQWHGISMLRRFNLLPGLPYLPQFDVDPSVNMQFAQHTTHSYEMELVNREFSD